MLDAPDIPYGFFKDSAGKVYVESENWSMPYHSKQQATDDELDCFINSYPNRDASEWEEWVCYSNKKRKRLKDNFFKMKEPNNMDCCETPKCGVQSMQTIAYKAFSLGNLQPIQWSKFNTEMNYNQEEGNNPMYDTVNTSTTERDQRKFLASSLYNARDEKITAARKAFHVEPVGPNKAKDLIEWIKADNFELKKEYEDYGLYDFMHVVKWVDKVNKPDDVGFADAKKAIDKAYTDAERVIKIKSPEAGLDALTAFEGQTFH